jgi:ABC-2 type transport system ATP-binding protein
MPDPIIHTERLTKAYGRARGIEDLDLDVLSGEVFGFLGPNGAGKTTTIRVLLDFIRPTSGRALLFGLDSRHGSREIRRRIGYLPGELTLYDSLSGHELLGYFASLRGQDSIEGARRIAARLDCDLSREIRTLSHGNRQKLGLIQALMGDPELVVLDEPTLGLDPQTRNQLWTHVRRLNEEEAVTVFLTTHYMEEAERVAHRIAVIDHGRIIAQDTPAGLKAATGTESLEQAFLAFTGTAIREEEATANEHMRRMARVMRR